MCIGGPLNKIYFLQLLNQNLIEMWFILINYFLSIITQREYHVHTQGMLYDYS